MSKLKASIDEIVHKADGTSKLAKALGIRPQAVSQWTRVPAKRVLAVELLTGISRHRLRPDIFGKAAQ